MSVYEGLLQGVIAHYTLEETSGSRLDSHGVNHLNQTRSPSVNTGQIGSALKLVNSASQALSASATCAFGMNDQDFSFSVWAKSPSAPGAAQGNRYIFTKCSCRNANFGEYALFMNTSASRITFQVAVSGLGNTQAVTAVTDVAVAGTWFHIACAHDAAANAIKIWFNGRSSGSAAHTVGCKSSSGVFNVGVVSNTDGWFDGDIDSLTIWKDRALSDEDAAALWNGGNGVDYPFISPALRVVTDWSKIPDISTYVKSYQVNRGRSSDLDRFGAGTATLTLDSPSGLFLPANSSGCLSGSLVPNRNLQIQWIVGGITAGSILKRFTGKTVKFTPEPTVRGERTVTLECTDAFEGFQRRETRSSLYTNISSGCLIGAALDAAEFPTACRAIDAGQDVYPFAFFDQRKVDEVLVDINQTEYGQIYVRGDGYFVFHDRYYRTRTVAAAASFIEAAVKVNFSRDANDLRTEARVSIAPRTIKPQTTIWTMQTPVSISPSSTASFFGDYIDPTTCQVCLATGVASPGIGSDALLNANASGTGANLSASLSACLTPFAGSFRVVASNAGATTGYLTTFNVSGCPVVSYNAISRNYIDPAACALYGVRTLTYNAPLMADPDQGQNMALFLVTRFSSPSNVDRVSMEIVNGDLTSWQQILLRDLDDRIALTASEIGYSSGTDFFIGYLSESWETGGLHSALWNLEQSAISDGFFLVDSSQIGGPTGLGY